MKPDYKRADGLRELLRSKGWDVMDAPNGPIPRKLSNFEMQKYAQGIGKKTKIKSPQKRA